MQPLLLSLLLVSFSSLFIFLLSFSFISVILEPVGSKKTCPLMPFHSNDRQQILFGYNYLIFYTPLWGRWDITYKLPNMFVVQFGIVYHKLIVPPMLLAHHPATQIQTHKALKIRMLLRPLPLLYKTVRLLIIGKALLC